MILVFSTLRFTSHTVQKNLIIDLVMYTNSLEGFKDVLIIVANISPLELGVRGYMNTVGRRMVQVMCSLWAALCFR